MFLLLLFIDILYIVHGRTLDCVYNSREYQIILKPDLFSGQKSFSDGVNLILDHLTSIEKGGIIDFRVSRSSLTYSNISIVRYAVSNPGDFKVPVKIKSRQKKINEPADFVLKFSNTDPAVACNPLTIADEYAEGLETKFEFDFHGYGGTVMAKTALSYTINNPQLLGFDQYQPVAVSDIFTSASKQLTYSGQSFVATPVGGDIQLTAEFKIRLCGEQYKATVFLLEIGEIRKSEFSFRIKGEDVPLKVLLAAQDFISQVSLIDSIVLHESEGVSICED